MNWLESLTPPHIRELVPYASARRLATEGQVWLNANENPYERDLPGQLSGLNRYPDFQPQGIMALYAGYAGLAMDQLLVTRGIDEGIDLLTRAFCAAGQDQIMYTPPTYGMYSISAKANNVKALSVPLLKTWQMDLPAMLKAAEYCKLIYVCSPNNPTGNLISRDDIETLLEQTVGQCLVVIDEAYIEFDLPSSAVNLLARFDHLVVLRTLSKAFGLAGLRCGFVLSSPQIIQILQKVSAPYPIPLPTETMVQQSLSEQGIMAMQAEVIEINEGRDELQIKLKEYSFVREVHFGNANFILFQVADAATLMQALQADGVIIRDQSAQIGLENTLRVSLGTPTELQLFYSAMEKFEANQ